MVNPFCCGSNQIVKLEQAPGVQNWRRFNQPCVRTKQGLVGPSAGNRQTAPFVVVKTQDFLSGDLPDLENGEALSFERMKRMGDQRPSQRGIGQECSLNGLSQLLEIELCKEPCSKSSNRSLSATSRPIATGCDLAIRKNHAK